MNVKEDKNNSFKSEFKGQDYYFCSDKCRQEFDRNPPSFARAERDRNENRPENRSENKDAKRPV